MSSIIGSLFAAVFALIAAGAPQPAAAAAVNDEVVVGTPQDDAATPRPVTETLRGVVDSVDQGHDRLKVRLSSDATEDFKVQDGLIFNSVRYGDPVELTIESIAGERTIVGLRKE